MKSAYAFSPQRSWGVIGGLGIEAKHKAALLLVLHAQGDIASGDDVVQGFHGVGRGLVVVVELRMAFGDAPQLATAVVVIHQSGDLANFDGLDNDALAKLPSLLALRDALYSQTFRDYVSHITGCGALSGRKTDMAINVYTPGCYLLCHDDVIGSRKVSYILYLTDPETPWKPEWGGALRRGRNRHQCRQRSRRF